MYHKVFKKTRLNYTFCQLFTQQYVCDITSKCLKVNVQLSLCIGITLWNCTAYAF
jgi:hypothetical protein